ncbi:MAG: hypothetical protein KDD94_14445, partial [Calditrichaeota bacterium]|nr:hypothetical protein [Calditrichota bacterium]
MGSKFNFRSVFVLALIVLSIYGLVPTYKYYTMPEETKQQLDTENDPSFVEMRSKILNLGLDLQGGMHMVVEMDLKAFLTKIATRQDEDLSAAIDLAIKDETTPVQTLRSELEKRGKDLVRYYGNRRNRSEDSDAEIQTVLIDKIDAAIDGIRDKISNRVDQFGVAEPIIQRLGERRIIIEL